MLASGIADNEARTKAAPATRSASQGAANGDLRAPFPLRKLILNHFDCICASHNVPGTWINEDDDVAPFDSVEYWVETGSAKLLERGKLHGIFLADSYGFLDVYENSIDSSLRGGFQIPKLDPSIIVGAMATVTTNLAFGVTASTTYEPPYALARRFTTLDHITNGRSAWNIVTSVLPSAARQFGLDKPVEHDLRYEMADEYMDVVYKLWESSWHDDSVKRDKKTRTFVEPSLVRPIDHKGKHFPDIPGPHSAHPSPQRTPALYQAGSSGAGTTFGAKHAEAVFVAQPTPAICAKKVAEYREKVKEFGRDPRSLKVLPQLLVFVAATDEEAQEKLKLAQLAEDSEVALAFAGVYINVNWAKFAEDEEIILEEGTPGKGFLDNLKRASPFITGPWTRKSVKEAIKIGRFGATVVGSAQTVADKIEEWITIGDVDGFNLTHYNRNKSIEDIVEFLIPELQRRGLFWDDYPKKPAGSKTKGGISAREGLHGKVGSAHLDPTHYGYSHKWILPKDANGGTQDST